MNILLNFYPVQSGGGQQVASNFLSSISKNDLEHSWFVFVGEGSELEKLSSNLLDVNNIFKYNYSYLSRIIVKRKLKEFIKVNEIDIIYNYAPTLGVQGIPEVVRSVYSNLYFPEIYFWEGYSFFQRIKKRGIDFLRLKKTLNADGLIFENESMLERAVTLFKYSETKVIYIEPSVSDFDESTLSDEYKSIENDEEFKILYLSSFYLNKNIHLLPDVAKVLMDKGHVVKFVLTLDRDDLNIQKWLIERIKLNCVDKYFEFIGKVSPLHVHQVVKSCDSMILLSKLECFSSNVMEAFYFKRPLIISDEIWAHSACKEAALYVDRNNALSIAEGIVKLKDNKKEIEHLVLKGKERLLKFNTPMEKIVKQVNFLKYIYKSYDKNN